MLENTDCNAEQLLLYHYQELDAEQSELTRSHLQRCSSCRDQLADIAASLAAVPRQELSFSRGQKQQFVDRVVARSRNRVRNRLPLWGGAMAAAAALALVFVLYNPTQQAVPERPKVNTLADLELLEQLEFLQDFELLQDLELLEDMEDLG